MRILIPKMIKPDVIITLNIFYKKNSNKNLIVNGNSY